MPKQQEKVKGSAESQAYKKIDRINGLHPWQKWVPRGYMAYKVRVLEKGEVTYFNYDLAKEMGLIKKSHPHRMNKKLHDKLLETFNLRIINEYDQRNGIEYPEDSIKKHPYMATRYLQLQHQNKRGETSGDGRSIWNGYIKHKSVVWDISSRGTGVTALSPGAVEADQPLQTGNTDCGYGCGLAEIDELYSSALMAETFHRNGITTERVLCIIDNGDGYGIGVRAGKNLFRPAHLFLYLKQGDQENLKKATEFLMDRQFNNGEWDFKPDDKKALDKLVEETCYSFAKFAAQLEREYIFAWLDWDGDNVLASAGIIDYGSIRQFGVRHDQYRYDDVERFSTTLNEQKNKAKLTIQVYEQLVDFLKTGDKKALKEFQDTRILKQFDNYYNYFLLEHFLYQVGFDPEQQRQLLLKRRKLVQDFYDEFILLEKAKVKRPSRKVEDGINRPPVFNMRTFLRLLPSELQKAKHQEPQAFAEHIFESILSDFSEAQDHKMSATVEQRILNLKSRYQQLIGFVSKNEDMNEALKQICFRSQNINRPDRVTGNGLVNIVVELLESLKKDMDNKSIQGIIDAFVDNQTVRPTEKPKPLTTRVSRKSSKLVKTMLTLLEDYSEDI